MRRRLRRDFFAETYRLLYIEDWLSIADRVSENMLGPKLAFSENEAPFFKAGVELEK